MDECHLVSPCLSDTEPTEPVKKHVMADSGPNMTSIPRACRGDAMLEPLCEERACHRHVPTF